MSKFVKFAEVSFEESLTFGLHPENRTLNPQHLKEKQQKQYHIRPNRKIKCK